MIVASDLDRTLIYSNRALEELGLPEKTKLKPVEKREGKWVTYMTETSFTLLLEICRKYLFVPITTRTMEQYQRIVAFQNEVPLTYAVTTNGAIILKNGEPLSEWSELVKIKMKAEAAVPKEVLSFLHTKGFRFNGRLKNVEGFFFYYILNTPMETGEKQALSDALSPMGWKVSLQGRKLYFIPSPINKGDALNFICNCEGTEAIAGAGDSILDWDFLYRCGCRLVPKHGELALDGCRHDFFITKKSGVLAGEEILSYLSL